MSRRSRVLSFGAAAVLVVAGIVCVATIGGGPGEILALVLIGIGMVGVVSLVFYEVGLSEDHERARETEGTAADPLPPSQRPRVGRRLQPPEPLDRMRGRHRRLR